MEGVEGGPCDTNGGGASAVFAQSATSAAFAQSATSSTHAAIVGFAGVEVQRVASVGITQNTDVAITFDTEARDDSNFWSATPQPTRVSAQTTGWHNVYATLEWGASAPATVVMQTTVRMSSSAYPLSIQVLVGGDYRLPVGGPVYMSSSDYLELIARQAGVTSYSVVFARMTVTR